MYWCAHSLAALLSLLSHFSTLFWLCETTEMDIAKNVDRSYVTKQRDAMLLMQAVEKRYQTRNPPNVIVELGSSTGKVTEEIGKLYPNAKVFGIEPDQALVNYAKANYKKMDNVVHVNADIFQANFWEQLALQAPTLKENSVDLVVSTHYLSITDPKFEVAFENISRLLKQDGGCMVAAISLWSDLFAIERRVMLQKYPDIFTKSQRASQLITMTQPDRAAEKIKLKKLFQQKGFGSAAQLVLVYNKIKLKTLKQVQQCLRWMAPLGSCLPATARLNFYSHFFEQIYEEYFGTRQSLHSFEYEYLFVSCHKIPK